MAASDNVVRSGLTPKFKDVQTLVKMLTYNHGPAESQILKGDPYQSSKTSVLYDPPIEEFSILRTNLSASQSEDFAAIQGPSIIIITSGSGVFTENQKQSEAKNGYAFFVGANVPISIKAGEQGLVAYRAFCVC
jgi:mannose-6-phosphate isomerase